MAAKSLSEAIKIAMVSGPALDFEKRAHILIREWAAHQVSSYGLKQLKSGSQNAELKYQIAMEVFAVLFPTSPQEDAETSLAIVLGVRDDS